MHIFFLFITLLSLLSCRSKSPTEETHEMQKWVGKSVSVLQKHPYFKNLPTKHFNHEGEAKSVLFTNQSKFQTGAYCQSLGGCIGLPVYNCQHVVKYKNDIITGIEETGTCPEAATIGP